MDIAGFRRPLLVFALSIVDEGIGVYCSSRGGKKVHYLGRSDSNLRAGMIKPVAEGPSGRPPYTHFWYRQEPSAMWAYRKEGQVNFSTVHPTTRTIRRCHPTRTGAALSLRVRRYRRLMKENAPWAHSYCRFSCG